MNPYRKRSEIQIFCPENLPVAHAGLHQVISNKRERILSGTKAQPLCKTSKSSKHIEILIDKFSRGDTIDMVTYNQNTHYMYSLRRPITNEKTHHTHHIPMPDCSSLPAIGTAFR
jgi:hypothetical protein